MVKWLNGSGCQKSYELRVAGKWLVVQIAMS